MSVDELAKATGIRVYEGLRDVLPNTNKNITRDRMLSYIVMDPNDSTKYSCVIDTTRTIPETEKEYYDMINESYAEGLSMGLYHGGGNC